MIIGPHAFAYLRGSGSAPTQSYRDLVMSAGPVGYWRMEDDPTSGTVTDETGNHPANIINQPAAIAGAVGQGYTFDGNDGRLQVGSDPALRPSSITLEFWLKVPAVPSSFEGLMGMTSGSSWDDGFGVTYNDDGNMHWWINDYQSGASTGLSALSDSAWHYIVCAYDGAQLTLDVDNSQVDSLSNSNGINHANRDFYMAFMEASYPSNLEYDEVALYDKVLTAQQRTDHYNAGLAA